MIRTLAAFAMLVLAPALPARAQAPGGVTPLQVETGMHQSTINRMVMLPGTSKLVSVSNDKTVRVWNADTLAPLGVIRPPFGPRDDGEITATDATGGILAIGGRIRYGDGFGVQFYRGSDLKLIGHRSNLPAPVSALKFSRDGHTLVVGMVAGRGLSFIDLHDGSVIPATTRFSGQVQWIDTDAQGRTVASGEDGKIRLYGSDPRKAAKETTLPNGALPYAVAFSPDGRTIAVGVQNAPLVWLLDAATLRPIRSLAGAPQRIGGFNVVAFSADGATLIGGGTYKASNNSPRLVRQWSLAHNEASEFGTGSDTITDLLPVGSDILLSDAEPIIEHADSAGHVRAQITAQHIDFRDAGLTGFSVSRDGTKIELPLPAGAMVFDARQRTLTPVANVGGLTAPAERSSGFTWTSWRNTVTPKLNNRPIQLEQDERSLAVATAPDGSAAALATNFYIHYQRADGTTWQSDAIPTPAWAVNISGDGRFVIAGLGDGSVRWYDAATSNEVLAFFVQPLTGHWVLSTPDGFFDHDQAAPGQPDGRNLIGFRFDDPTAETSHFTLSGQFYPVFYRPDLIGLALRNDAASQAAIASARERIGSVSVVLDRGVPATLAVADACGVALPSKSSGCPTTRATDAANPAAHAGARFATTAPAVRVSYRLTNPDGQPGRARIFRNGAAITPSLFTTDEDAHNLAQEATIPLGDGANTIRILPVSSNGEIEARDSAAASFTVWQTPPPPDPTQPAPHRKTLYLLSVGVSKFAHPEINLDNADSDAAAVAKLMNVADHPVYDVAVVKPLTNKDATANNILAALREISADAQPDDLVVLFLAGHGQEVDGKYYFAPSDIGTRQPELFARAISGAPNASAAVDQLFRTEGLGPDTLLPLIQGIKATHVAVVLDTCYSASLATQDAVFQHDVNTTVTNTLGHATGRFVVSSATTLALDSSGVSADLPQDGEGHGLFTAYLLQALEGKADVAHAGQVDVIQLATYLVRRVEQATKGKAQEQVPTWFFSGNDLFALHTAPNAVSQ